MQIFHLTPPEKLGNFTEITDTGDNEFNTSRLRFGYNKLKLHPDISTPRKDKKIPSNHVKYRKGVEVPWIDQYERGQTVPSSSVGMRVANWFSDGYYTGEIIDTYQDDNGTQRWRVLYDDGDIDDINFNRLRDGLFVISLYPDGQVF